MDTKDFSGQVAVVTGAASGIGYEIGRRLALAGASVVLNDLDGDALETAIARIEAEGGSCASLAGDAGDGVFVESLVEFAVDRFGRLDMAVANAGLTRFNSILEIQAEELQSMVHLNLGGSVFLAKFAARRMIKQGGGGRILFMSSVTGSRAHPGVVCYGMTKAGISMLAKGLVVELAGHGITTNAIAPGATLTERTVGGDARYEEKWVGVTPTGRVTRPADIAGTALWLLGAESGQVTGQTIVVDGGWSATSEVPEFGH